MTSHRVEVLPIPEAEKPLLRNLMQAYGHDLSEFDNSEMDESGLFNVGPYFDLYWTEATRHPLKIQVGESLAGFVLVRELGPRTYSIAEFFVLRSHRRCGIGRKVAFQVFDQFPGTWRVAQARGNTPAQEFWRRVIDEYTDGVYEEEWSTGQPEGPQQVFQTPTD